MTAAATSFKARQPFHLPRPVYWMSARSKTAPGAAEQKSGGTYLGAYHSIFSISQIASPLLGAWIYSALGGHVLWLICGGLSLLAVAILWIFGLGREPAPLFISPERASK